MITQITDETPIAMLTVGQLREVLKTNTPVVVEQKPTVRYLVYGYHGLAELLGISRCWAGRLKLDGVFDEALMQQGRTIVFDADKVLEIWGRKTGGRNK